MIKKAINIAGLALFLSTGMCYAVPPGFNVQGRLTDANGINRDGNFQITFSVFSSPTGGTALWTKQLNVTVRNGNFQVVLQGAGDTGKDIEDVVKSINEAFLEIKVADEQPMVPRQQLLRSPLSAAPNILSGPGDVIINSDEKATGAGSIFLKTANIDRITITNSGNVGIGTTGTTSALYVLRNANIQQLVLENSNAGGSTGIQIIGDSSRKNWLIGKQHNVGESLEITPSSVIGGITFSTPAIVIKDNGNVGIGTTSPSQKITVNGIVESLNGGFKFPNQTIQTTAFSNCVFTLKPTGGGNVSNYGEGGSCSIISSGQIRCRSWDGFAWYMEFSVCYKCEGLSEICGPTTRIEQIEHD